MKNHFFKKAVASIMAITMLLGSIHFSPFAVSVAAAGGDIFSDIGMDRNPNNLTDNAERKKLSPYGSDKVILSPVSEVTVTKGASSVITPTTYLHERPLVNQPFALTGSAGAKTFTPSTNTKATAIREVAGDFDGNGKDDQIASYSLLYDSTTQAATFTLQIYNAVDGSKVGNASTLFTYTMQHAWYFYKQRSAMWDDLLTIAVGDFNGCGVDEIVCVYYDSAMDGSSHSKYSPRLRIVNFDKGTWSFGTTGQLFPWLRMPTLVSLSFGDLNQDGYEDFAYAVGSTFVYPDEFSNPGNAQMVPSKIRVVYGDKGRTLTNRGYMDADNSFDIPALDVIGAGLDIVDTDGDGLKELLIGGFTHPYTENAVTDKLMIKSRSGDNYSELIRVYKFNHADEVNKLELQYTSKFPMPFYPHIYTPSNITAFKPNGIAGGCVIYKDSQTFVPDTGNNHWKPDRAFWDPSQYPNGDKIFSSLHRSGWDAIGADIYGNGKEVLILKAPGANSTLDHRVLIYRYNDKTEENWYVAGPQTNPLCFSLPNTDNDSIYLEFESYELAFTDPTILAALASPPYYKDLTKVTGGDTYMDNTTTTFGSTKTTGTEKTFNVGTNGGFYVGYSLDITMPITGVQVGSIEMEAATNIELTYETRQYQTKTQEVAYTTKAGQDSVVLYSIPMDVYKYKAHIPNEDGKTYTAADSYVTVPYAATTATISAEKYSEIYNTYKSSGISLPDIGNDVFTHTLGDPATYRTSTAGLIAPWVSDSPATVVPGNVSTVQSLSTETGSSQGVSISNSINFKAGGGPGALIVGGTWGVFRGSSEAWTTSEGMAFTGSLAGLPTIAGSPVNYGYGYDWRLLQYNYKGTQNFPVITYLLSNVKMPPVLPDDGDFYIKKTTDESITVAWNKSKDSTVSKYELFMTSDYGTYTLLESFDAGLESYEFEQDGLQSGKPYKFALQVSRMTAPQKSVYSAPLLGITNAKGMGNVTLSGLTDKVVNAASTEARFAVSIQKESEAYITQMQWQKKDGNDFVDISPAENDTAKKSTLVITNPTNNTGEYRFRYRQIDSAGRQYDTLSDSVFLRYIDVSLDITGTHTVAVGYGDQTPITATVTNTGSDSATGLTVSLSGANAGDFTVTQPISTTLTGTEATTFTVTPNAGLAAGSYITTVHVTGNNEIAKTFDVLLSVTNTTHAVTVNSIGTNPSANNNYAAGETVSVSAGTPPNDMQFKEWSVTGLTNATLTDNPIEFTMPSNDVTLTAVFENIPATVLSVDITPSAISLQAGMVYTFSAKVNGTNNPAQTVTWDVSGGSGTTAIDVAGRLAIDEYETAQTLTVTATSAVNPSISGLAAVTIEASEEIATVTGVTVTPDEITLGKSDTYTFSATVVGTNNPSQEVSWSVIDGISGTSIASDGTLTISADETAAAVTVKATSVADTSVYGTATVTIPVQIPTYAVTVINGGGSSVGTGNYKEGDTVLIYCGWKENLRFVTWITEGIVLANPTVTNPQFIMPANPVTVTAVFGEVPRVLSVNLNSSSYSVQKGSSLTYTAVVSVVNNAPTTVTWSVLGGVSGTTITDGVLTVAEDETATSLTVKATSTFNTDCSASTTVTIETPLAGYPVAVVSEGTSPHGDGTYKTGEAVTISAGTPPPGKKFKQWTTEDGITIASTTNATTTFTMPASAVTVTAVFEDIVVAKYPVYVVSEGSNASGGGQYEAGTTVNIFAGTPPSGMRFKQWTATGTTLTNTSDVSTSFIMPANTVTVTAVYEDIPDTMQKYTLTVTQAMGGNAIISGSGSSGDYIEGAEAFIIASAENGYRFTEWTSTNGGTFENANEQSTIFTMPAGPTTVTAIFEVIVSYALTIEAGTGGSITVGTSGQSEAGVVIDIAALPDADYKFIGWSSSDGGSFSDASSANTTFTMPANATTVTASFAPVSAPTYAFTIEAGTGGTITTGANGLNETGKVINITATPNANYSFNGWASSNGGIFGNASSATTTFTMPANATTVTASFVPISVTKYTFTIQAGTGGTITTGASGQNEAGKIINVAATPNANYSFNGWTSSNGGTFDDASSAITTFTMPANATTVTASFVPISVTTYAFTIQAGTGGTITTGASGQNEAGKIINVAATPNANYSFNGWTSSNGGTFGNAYSASTTFTMPANATTITAYFDYVSDSGNTGDNSNGGGGSTPPSTPSTVTGDTVTPTATTNSTTGITSATVSSAEVTRALANAQKAATVENNAVVVINVPAPANSTAVETTIAAAAFTAIKGSENTDLTVKAGDMILSFSDEALSGITGTGNVKISAGTADKTNLNTRQQVAVGDRPVFDFSVTVGGNTVSKFGGAVTVSVPYTPATGENPNAIIIYYIDATGNLKTVENCFYDPATKTVTFTSTHFSLYMIGYNFMTFNDVKNHWGKSAIEFSAARGLVSGVGNGNYDPDRSITRAEFVQLMQNVLKFPAALSSTASYADVANSQWYYKAIMSAKALGVLNGISIDGNNFKPNEPITREEMAVILANVAIYKNIATVNGIVDLKKFSDYQAIKNDYLDELELAIKLGLMSKDGIGSGKFDPQGETTRAQAAQVQKNLLLVLNGK